MRLRSLDLDKWLIKLHLCQFHHHHRKLFVFKTSKSFFFTKKKPQFKKPIPVWSKFKLNSILLHFNKVLDVSTQIGNDRYLAFNVLHRYTVGEVKQSVPTPPTSSWPVRSAPLVYLGPVSWTPFSKSRYKNFHPAPATELFLRDLSLSEDKINKRHITHTVLKQLFVN